MHHHIPEIDQHPFGLLLALDPERPYAPPGRLCHDLVGECAHLAVGATARDDHEIGDVGEGADVEHSDIDGLDLVQGGERHVTEVLWFDHFAVYR